ncbi:sensor histidine kinase [Vibrio neptunius]|uniref:histidine kinase n=1 Tax=Vibrio neptunius TaxID=170651 RepID=A0ABS3A1V7_9VIBR|nr:HAMP domain-containing sensor histidine kinase [Vibrio neptunius]MBN3492876.1 HAMP domain-containing histidine kinase [Vibrio neptunius]MBN3515406.1 HAMP domain-containing histidine kinase [Vibrio neptunius]MBN3549408.1 HAMP domain-containing histidine kinase [Vibrio neptunius]MBN3577677.1 HAMP domain-containing histidine kinase [Vibrio neptunius]MCH9871341.1 HAMP domain-containing histidine kinase [Vibrio neptunius]
MSSSHNIEQALAKARNTLLMRFMAILLLCLILVEVVVGVMFFFDLYRTEKKILNSMATEYQRILTYDSADQLIHVLTANPHRLIENNIAAFSISKERAASPNFVAGDSNLTADIQLDKYLAGDKSWFTAFILNPYISLQIKGEALDFWLVLDNQPRYAIAYKQWLMTLYALLVLVAITTLFTHRIIRSAMSPLVTLGDSLDKLSQGKLEMTDNPAAMPQGLSVISASVHDAIARLHHVTTTLNTTVDAIAHDIRTPLSRITLSSQSALLDNKDTQQMEHALSDCAEYAMQANNMLTALMKLNDEVTGKREQQSTSTHVSEVLKTVVSWYEDVADDKQIQLQARADDNLIIQSDPEKLTQALVNLVDNAIKYTEMGGKVSLKAHKTSDHQVEILVSDTGIGIDKQYQDLIFERLYRIDASRSNIEGYGLGLSLAAAMVDNLGGSIQLVSEPNQGSTFTIKLTANSNSD